MLSTDTAPIPETTVRSMVLLNEMGDIEITWDESQDETIKQMIEEKMAQGINFYEVKATPLFRRKKPIKTVEELKERKLKVTDQHVAELFALGKVSLSRRDTSSETMDIKRVSDPAIAAKTSTVATRQFTGG